MVVNWVCTWLVSWVCACATGNEAAAANACTMLVTHNRAIGPVIASILLRGSLQYLAHNRAARQAAGGRCRVPSGDHAAGAPQASCAVAREVELALFIDIVTAVEALCVPCSSMGPDCNSCPPRHPDFDRQGQARSPGRWDPSRCSTR